MELRKSVYEYAAWHLRFSGIEKFASYLRTLGLNIEELLDEKICDHIETMPESVGSLVLITKPVGKGGLGRYYSCPFDVRYLVGSGLLETHRIFES